MNRKNERPPLTALFADGAAPGRRRLWVVFNPRGNPLGDTCAPTRERALEKLRESLHTSDADALHAAGFRAVPFTENADA